MSTDVGGIRHRKPPKVGGDGLWPIVLSEEEHGSSRVAKVTNAFFGHAVLMMRVHSTVGYGLVPCSTSCFENSVRKDSIITMIMFDADLVRSGKPFKCKFPFHN